MEQIYYVLWDEKGKICFLISFTQCIFAINNDEATLEGICNSNFSK